MKNEYDRLQKVIMAKPTFMKITEIINEVQKIYCKENIDINKALTQHERFSKSLENEGVEIIYLDNHPNLNEQVFTRDIGFVIDETICVGNLKENIRKNEKEMLVKELKKRKLTFFEFKHAIEGGDVVIHHDKIFIGVGNRTSNEAILEIKETFPDKEIVEIKLSGGILHLDCVFNILNEKFALVYQEGMDKKSLEYLSTQFELIPISKEEQETMGTNILSIGNKKVVSLSSQKRINELLKAHGFTILENDFSEIIKSGGSFRCCTFPIERN